MPGPPTTWYLSQATSAPIATCSGLEVLDGKIPPALLESIPDCPQFSLLCDPKIHLGI